MGDGTADGVQTPNQPGVIVREGENFPPIPGYLLKKTPEQLQESIDRISRAVEFASSGIFNDENEINRLEESKILYQFAKTAVERNQQKAE
jgi:hypothetical protein